MTVTLALLIALAIGPQTGRVQTATIQGTVVDAGSQAPLRDARVQLVELVRSVPTDKDGHFEFSNIAPGRYTLTVSTIGYIFVKRSLDLSPNTDLHLTIPLAEGTGTYEEKVTVVADKRGATDVGVSSQNELGSAQLAALRGVAGDDPMRAVQSLPGVVTGDEFQAQFSVRGSAFRQTGIVIDGVVTPLLLNEVRGRNDTGSIAMINSDILDRATLQSGAHPQRNGEWLGATLEFGVREGSRDRVQFRGAASGTSASLVVEGPIGSAHKGSWLVSARKSYLGWLVQKLDPQIDSTVNFADGQSKIVYDLTAHQQIQVLLLGGDATYDQLQQVGVANGLSHTTSRGAVASAAWRYSRGTWLVTQRVSFATSDFLNRGISAQELGRGTERQLIWRGDASWFVSPAWRLEFGSQVNAEHQNDSLRQFTTVSGGGLRETNSTGFADQTTGSAAWGQIARRTSRSGIVFGARYAKDQRTDFQATRPWLLAERTFGSVTFRGGAGFSGQVATLDIQHSAPAPLTPESAVSLDGGIEHRLTTKLRWQITAFGRNETDGLRRVSEDQVVNGKAVAGAPFPLFASPLNGWSRGVEVMVARRATTGLTGWVAYTYAHTHYRDTGTGEMFDGDFDQRHTFNMFLQQRLSYRTTINAKLRVGSNVPLVGYFAGTTSSLLLAGARNLVRLPTYARLDIRADRTFTFNRRRLTLFAEVVNLLGRTNLRQTSGSFNSKTLVAINYTQREIPFVPSIGMLIEF
jgi:hypothetical protein